METTAKAKLIPPAGERLVELTLTMPESLAKILKYFAGSLSYRDELNVTERATLEFHTHVIYEIYIALHKAGIS